MIKSKKFIGMPVISLSEGQQIGKIKELVVDPHSKSVAALLIEQKGWFKDQKFIPYGKVCSVGDDAITIEQSANIQKGASLPEILQLTKDKYQLLNEKVVTENGKVIGMVEEYYVDIFTGDIAGLEVSGSFINSLMSGRAFLDMALVRTIGKELIVTSNDAPDNLVKINGGFKETVKSLKCTGDNLWESTISKTKELTSTINKKLINLKNEKDKNKDKDSPCQCGECTPNKVLPEDNGEQQKSVAAEAPIDQLNNEQPVDDVAPENKNATKEDTGPEDKDDAPRQ
ncbi:PRC-barrel domain-containing protein [Peptococcaceae bacterium 1198_IL3148]